MARALVILAPGFEEIEATTVIDVLRRADVGVLVAGLMSGPVRGSHGITLVPDQPLDHLSPDDFDALVLPGGMPGAQHLRDSSRVLALVKSFTAKQKIVAAICAAPTVLEAAGVLAGRRATGFPGFELPSAIYAEDRVVADGTLVTSRGAGTAMEFALALAARLATPDKAAEVAARMLARA